jgi:predicted RNase H-like nuclease
VDSTTIKSRRPKILPRVRVAGIDGTKGGWVAIVLHDGAFASDHVLRPVATTFDSLNAEVIAVDVPIGFGPRRADQAARDYMKGAASTVFATPRRAVLDLPFGPGLGVNAQAHALGPRIIHVTELAAADRRVYEVHPEVSFRAMNDGRPLQHRKKSASGALKRIALLRRHRIDIERLGEAAAVPLDDVLDAAAAAWSAQRIALGTAATLPEEPDLVDGRAIAIWY